MCHLVKTLVIGLLCVCLGAQGTFARPVLVFAASSLQGPLDRVAESFDGEVIVSYGGSGSIARQVSLGAPADVVVLASPDWMTWLEEGGYLIAPAQTFATNRLVLIGPAGAKTRTDVDLGQLIVWLDEGRLAIGHHQAVPAGVYASEWLSSIGQWDEIRPHLVETENARAALTLVARGEAPLGIVYASDAIGEPAVSIVYSVPVDRHAPIQYPVAPLTEAGVPFAAYLISQSRVFEEAGFRERP